MDVEHGLTLSYIPVGRNGSATLTARLNGEVLAVEKVDLAKPQARSKFVESFCAGRPGIDRAEVERELLQMAADMTERPVDQPAEKPSADDMLANMPEAVRADALAMLEAPDLLKRIIDDVAALGVAGEREMVATLYLCGVSRLLNKPLAIIVQGPTSTGKSYVPERVAELFPSEAVIHATQMTPQALYHMEPGSLSHRWIVAGERSRLENDDSAEATRALREMLSAGKLSKLMPVKVGGEIITQRIEQEGPIAFVETTTLSTIFDEDLNRCLLLHSDERPEQTRRILSRQAKAYAGSTPTDAEHITERHHAVQRLLESVPVVIPFAERLAEKLAIDRVEVRRAFPLLMSAIEASVLLHQRQRSRDEDGRLIAKADDYKLVHYLLAKPMSRALGGGLSEPARRFYERLLGWATGEFSTTEVKRHEAGHDRASYGWLAECHRFGLVEVVEPGRGPKPAIWKLLADGPDPSGCPALPSVDELFGAETSNTLACKA